jgi:hypothetical protein
MSTQRLLIRRAMMSRLTTVYCHLSGTLTKSSCDIVTWVIRCDHRRLAGLLVRPVLETRPCPQSNRGTAKSSNEENFPGLISWLDVVGVINATTLSSRYFGIWIQAVALEVQCGVSVL